MRALICSLASPGFLYPAIELAKSLRSRGHEVAFVTDIQFHEFLERVGFRRFERSTPDGSSFQVDIWFQPVSVAIQVKHIAAALKQFSPDVLIGQCLTLGPLIATDCFRIPLAILGQLTYLLPSTLDRRLPPSAVEKSEIYSRAARRLWRESEFLKHLNAARKALGLAEVGLDNDRNPLVGDLHMVRSIRRLETDIDALPPEVHLVGSCTWENELPDPEVQSWIQISKDENRPLLYIQQGRTFGKPGFWKALMEVAAQLPVIMIASVGRTDQSIIDVPPNVFLKPHIPQTQVLESAAGVISNGNSAVTVGALLAGVPSLVFPEGGEQLDVAEVCENIGVAEVWDQRISIDGPILRSRIDRLLHEESLRQAGRDFQALLRDESNWTSAAELLETLVQKKQPVLRTSSAEHPLQQRTAAEPVLSHSA